MKSSIETLQQGITGLDAKIAAPDPERSGAPTALGDHPVGARMRPRDRRGAVRGDAGARRHRQSAGGRRWRAWCPRAGTAAGVAGRAGCAAGRRHVRNALYAAATSAIRCNPDLKTLHERLSAEGKPFKVAIVATMRKLVPTAQHLAAPGPGYGGRRHRPLRPEIGDPGPLYRDPRGREPRLARDSARSADGSVPNPR